MKDILINELKLYPKMKVSDLYKFLHQASFGSEHAIKDTSFVRNWLKTEISGLDLTISDPLISHLSPDGQIVRVNLRPWVIAGYDSEKLLDAFVRTANYYKPETVNFQSYLQCARELAEEKYFTFSVKKLDRFIKRREKEGLPAIHHSAFYERKYHPAYRVVHIDILREYIPEI